jgi:hypothetical protein
MVEVKKKKEETGGSVLDRVFGKPNEQQNAPSEAENVALIIKEWLNPIHVKAKTRLTKPQVLSVAILQSLADTYNIKTLKRFLVEFKTAKLSEDGKSSAELEGILKARLPEESDIELKKLSRFLE